MAKKVLVIIAVLSLVSILGCSVTGGQKESSVPPAPQTLRKAEIDEKWQMYQLRIEAPAGSALPILLRLSDGDKVDGYFYLEKGSNLDFQIAGSSLLYKLEGQDKKSSSRFSFTATQEQGTTYILTLHNSASDKQDKVTVFLEIMYPVTGSIFIPLEAK